MVSKNLSVYSVCLSVCLSPNCPFCIEFIRFIDILVQNGYLLSYIDIIYRIDWLLRTVFGNSKGNGPISTHDTVKFIKFWSIIYRFKMIYCYPQEFACNSTLIVPFSLKISYCITGFMFMAVCSCFSFP